MAIPKKVSELTEDTAPTTDDFVLAVDNATAASKKVTMGNLVSVAAAAIIAAAKARANHTGTQTASTISDFNTQVATTAALKANNLSDLSSASTARTNLGLGTLATQSGTFSGTSSGTNTGDETTATIKTKLSITTLSGSNTGDQTLSDATISTTDITTNNVSTTKHGFAPKLPNDATKYLDGTGAYTVPAGSGGGSGDASTNTATSVDSELALFSGTAGKTLKRATTTGILKGTSGVLSAATAGTDYQAPITLTTTGSSGAATLISNTLNIPQYTGGSGDMVLASAQTVTGAKTFNSGALLDKGNNVFNVKAYGAVGNDSTDDTTAIQNTIDAANTAGGGVVWFPAGTYKITAALKLYSGTTPTIVPYQDITLKGAGASGTGTTIKQYTTGADAIKGLNDVANGAQSLNITLQDFMVLFGGAVLTNSGNGIYLAQQASGGPSFSQYNLKNITASSFQGSGKYGFNFESAIVSTIDTCQAVECANGFYVNGTVGGNYGSVSTSITFLNCYANMNTNGVNGYRVVDATYISFVSCAADFSSNSTGTAYLLEGSNCVTFQGCGTELNGTATLGNMWKIAADSFSNPSSQISLYGCYGYLGKSSVSVYVTGTSSATVVGFQDNSSVSGATGLKVDAGSSATEIDNSWGATATPRSINATGINTILSDMAGGLTAKTVNVTTQAIFSGSTSGTTTVKATATAGSTTLTLPAATDTLVGKATTDSLSNKSLVSPNIDSNALFTDITDPTKKIQFALSGITTGTTRTITFPNTGITVVGSSNTGTLSNKTLDNTTTANIKDTLFTLQDDGDATKLLQFQLSGITTGTTRTLTVPDSSGTLTLNGAVQTISGAKTFNNATLLLAGSTSGTTTLNATATASGTLTLPAATDTLVGKATTDTLTNKRVTKRTGTTTSSATPAINSDNVDFYSITALAVDITGFTMTGTPTDGQTLWIAITGTAARAITWGASFESSTVTLPSTTVTTARLDVGFVWNAATSKYRCVAVA